ncbi:EAL domain-containing protein [Telmatospirillum sp.]|uniref:putative bifunctional diguanylate cyclase/phosphodiesterase n=1 Tax=Telmatospirillum sp. TaxID=2079197 RepID=UPI0028525DB5|nr:EAL domain-containing protein [Telmatospirillum sp.]
MAVVFSAFTLILSSSLYRSQEQLRIATNARLVADNGRRADAVAEFIAERRKTVLELSRCPEIEGYLVNRDLGMSPQYGLNLALEAINQRFDYEIKQKTLRGQPVYTRIVFRGEDGDILAEVGQDVQDEIIKAIPADAPVLQEDSEAWRIVASAPVVHKGIPRGTVVTLSDMRLLSRLLIGRGVRGAAAGRYQEFLLADGGISVPASEESESLSADIGRAFTRLPINKVTAAADLIDATEFSNLLALRTSIVGSRLSMLTLTSATDAYGQMASTTYVPLLWAVSLAMLLAAFGFERMQQRTMRLQNDYAESNHHRAELAQRNQALSEEILRRQAVETDLYEKTLALDKSNADLRASRERLDFALQGANDGIWDWNLETDEVYYSPRWKSMLGYDEFELTGTPDTLISRVDPEHRAQLLAQITNCAEGRSDGIEIEFRMRHRVGHWVDILSRATLAKDAEGGPTIPKRLVGTHVDISMRKATEDENRYLAFYDPLTCLPNRRLLFDRLHQALVSSARSKHHGALFFIDLDNFKDLNDTLGHDQGDLLLQQVALRLATCIRKSDTVARLGGDEFVVMLEDLNESRDEAADQAEIVAGKILVTLNETYQFDDHDIRSTPSIGATLFGKDADSVDELLKQADLAMYQAKAAGRNTLRFFDPDMQAAVVARAALEIDLRGAIANRQFSPYYQAQVDSSGHVVGAEVLLRWLHPQRGTVLPYEFIPLAEKTGLILPLGNWVLDAACTQLAQWAGKAGMAGLTVAVNVSARQIHQPDFVDQVLAILRRTGAIPQKLKLELTESLLLEDVEDIIGKMTALKSFGVSFSLDDFGTGYSSLSYLKRLPLDQLKIDQSFVRDILNDQNNATIARTIVTLGHSLGLAVIAEGVETGAQRDFLASIGCLVYQGYLFSRPLPLADFEAFAYGSPCR